MALATIHSRAVCGIQAYPVTIEVHISPGYPGLGMVGLPETSVKESRYRVRSAIMSSGYKYPAKRITINLAPADQPKIGANFDLPMALGILAASDQLPNVDWQAYEFFGELALSGKLQSVQSMLPIAMATHKAKRALMIPIGSVAEASIVSGLKIYAASSLREFAHHLQEIKLLNPISSAVPAIKSPDYRCMSEVRGHVMAKRALEVAASGRHHLLMSGPPGSGKTMLAGCLPGILPEMPQQEALETAALYSLKLGRFDPTLWRRRPFCSPHHTTSAIAIIGGGKQPQPGEVSLAHNGVLFMDEFPQFQPSVLETLREPLESREVHISRASGQAIFPAAFQLIGAMNPCPCGYYGDLAKNCHCTSEQVKKYQTRISGPLRDRIDLQLQVGRIATKELFQAADENAETSQAVRLRVTDAFKVQWQRAGKANVDMSAKEVERFCKLGRSEQRLLEKAIDALNMSGRAVHRVLKVGRSIADLEKSPQIEGLHLSEALSYRGLALD